jgi:hypothetical protein
MRGRIGAFLTAAAAGFLLIAPAALASDAWTQWTASPQETTIRSLDFTAATTLVASSESDGIFQSPATQGPWTQTNSGLPQGGLSAYQVVASGGSLYAATGGGLFTAPQGPNPSWTQLGAGPGNNTLDMGGIESVVVESPSALVVAVAGAAGPGVYTSSDGGGTWTRASGMPTGENIFNLAKGAGSVIYAAGDSGVWTSVDGGGSWTLTSDGINPAETAFRVAVGPAANEVWAAADQDVYQSTDGGSTWINVDGTGPTALPAAQVKSAFLLAPSLNAGDVIVGTNDGAWASNDGGQNWGQMSQDAVGQPGYFGSRIVTALGVGFSPPALLAGTRGFGVFSLPLTAVSSAGTPAVQPNSGLQPGDSMSVTANWLGTLPWFVTYTWKRCQGASCTTVGQGPDYTIPNADASSTYAYEVQACATNLLQTTPQCATSAKTTGGVAAVPGSEPVPLSGGTPSSISPDPHVSYPWGTTFTIDPGQWGTEAHPGTQINPVVYSYLWQRCDQSSTCTSIPGATAASYTTTAADVGDTIRGYVAVDSFFGSTPSQLYEADETFTIIEKTPVNTAAPRIIGQPYVGQTLNSTAGAWSAHNPTYTRRWLECNSDGLDCQPLSPDQTGHAYTITPADLGNVLELEVTATQFDPSQNRVAVADSAPTSVITNPPSSPGGGSPGPTPSPTPTPTPSPAPTSPPKLGKLHLKHKGTKLTLTFNLTGSGAAIVSLQRITPGHRVRHRCVSGKKKHARACTFYKTEHTVTRRGLKGGKVTVVLSTKVHGHKLPPGRYRVLVTPVSVTGKRGAPRSIGLILRRR